MDKLLNYIRYWQASGESIKNSVWVKTHMEQMTGKGLYIGHITMCDTLANVTADQGMG